MLRRWVAFAVVLCAVVMMIPRTVRADNSSAHSVAVAVLALDSDDAEENADALTGALRSKIRNSQGWSLVETTQTLGMLTQPISFAGLPVVSAPVPSPDPSALPCGVQVIGAHGADAVAFGAARQLSERLWGGDATARPSHTPVSAT